jgi:integrative and conjugative element protein (TIGR02256 family)
MWVRDRVVTAMTAEASSRYPLETGGVLMGYWSGSDDLIVTHAIGAGPSAQHHRETFNPDSAWQTEEIARHYSASGRVETYLGDWHSHPGHDGFGLSRRDRATLLRIATDPAARAPVALMAVMVGEPEDWHVAAWLGSAIRCCGFFRRLSLEAVLPRSSDT